MPQKPHLPRNAAHLPLLKAARFLRFMELSVEQLGLLLREAQLVLQVLHDRMQQGVPSVIISR